MKRQVFATNSDSIYDVQVCFGDSDGSGHHYLVFADSPEEAEADAELEAYNDIDVVAYTPLGDLTWEVRCEFYSHIEEYEVYFDEEPTEEEILKAGLDEAELDLKIVSCKLART